MPPGNRYQVETDGGPVEIGQIIANAVLWTDVSEEPIERVTQYSGVAGEAIAQSVHFALEHKTDKIDVHFHNVRDTKDTFVTVKVEPAKDGGNTVDTD